MPDHTFNHLLRQELPAHLRGLFLATDLHALTEPADILAHEQDNLWAFPCVDLVTEHLHYREEQAELPDRLEPQVTLRRYQPYPVQIVSATEEYDHLHVTLLTYYASPYEANQPGVYEYADWIRELRVQLRPVGASTPLYVLELPRLDKYFRDPEAVVAELHAHPVYVATLAAQLIQDYHLTHGLDG